MAQTCDLEEIRSRYVGVMTCLDPNVCTAAPRARRYTQRWTMSDFISFYRPAECRAAIALARERSSSIQNSVDAKRAALVGEGNKVST